MLKPSVMVRPLVDIDSITDEIYRAVIDPARWHNVLEHMVEISDAEGALLFTSGAGLMRWVCSPKIASTVQKWITSGWVKRNSRVRLISRTEPRFLRDYDGFTPEELETDPFYTEFLRPHGLGWCVGTVIRLPAGDTTVFSIEKAYEKGPVDQEAVNVLDRLRPHLERAAGLSVAAGREHARTVVGLLQSIGVPAAALRSNAQSLVANQLLLNSAPAINQGADDRLTFCSEEVQAAVAKALDEIHDPLSQVTHRSVVLSGMDGDFQSILHLVRLDHSAQNVFSEAQAS